MKKELIIGGLVLILVIAGLYFGYNKVKEDSTMLGYNACIVQTGDVILQSLQTNGYIDMMINNKPLRLVPEVVQS